MAGSIALSLTQQLDKFGKPLAGGKLYIIQAGTVSTPQIAYQDSALTLPVSGGSTITLDAYGRLPQFFLADGSIKIRLTDVNGVQQFAQDGILVVGASSGGGGGSPVDPTTILQPGWLQAVYGTGIISGFVRANGRTIGSATSGATERANADTAALYSFLYGQDPNLAVATGRGVSAAADYAANKAMTLPDWRGRALAFLDDMGNTAAGRLTATYFGTAATVLGAGGGLERSPALLTANLPAYTPTGSVTTTTTSSVGANAQLQFPAQNPSAVAVGGTSSGGSFQQPSAFSSTSTFTGAAQGGTSTPFAVASPMMLATIYLKL